MGDQPHDAAVHIENVNATMTQCLCDGVRLMMILVTDARVIVVAIAYSGSTDKFLSDCGTNGHVRRERAVI